MSFIKSGTVVVVAGIIVSVSAGPARADTLSLRCAVSAKHQEARLLWCVARCEERGEGEEDTSCRYRCDAHYDSAIATRRCETDAPSASSVHSNALYREARVELVNARMLKCSARCGDSLSPDTCLARCERRYLAESESETYKRLSALGIDSPE